MLGKLNIAFKESNFNIENWTKLLLLVIIANDAYDDPRRFIAIPIIFLSFLGLLFRGWILRQPLYWFLFIGLIPPLKEGYELAANHHYLEFYLTLTIFLQLILKRPFEEVQQVFKWIFSFLMAFAFFHKLITPEVRSGEAYHLMWSSGVMFQEISPWLFENYTGLVERNLQSLDKLGFMPTDEHINLNAGPAFLPAFFFIYAWLIILFELVLTFIFWTRFQLVGQILVLLFIVFVPLATWENTFLSLVALLTLGLTEEKKAFFYPFYSLLILLYMSINF